MRKGEPASTRFWRNVNKDGPVLVPRLGACWLWTGSQDGKGRGTFYFEGEKRKAPRVAWFLETGQWPTPCALHKCDNALCVRFSHLFEGDQLANIQDAVRKGRNRNGVCKGETNVSAKLTTEDVLLIREYIASGATNQQLAEMYKVSKSLISNIKLRKTWCHI